MSERQGVFNGKATAVFQYMPPGKSVICATVDGKPARREVFVDASTAERLQRDLVEKLAAADAGQKAAPCGLFDHRDGAACLHPKRFTWDDERGVLLEAEWTQAGKAAVEGKDYLYWSPTFRRHKESGRVVGLQAGVEVGSLVNNPAFESIEPVAAAAADDGGALEGECEDVNCCGREVPAVEKKELHQDEGTMKKDNEPNDGGEEVFASKRVCDALLDALEAVSAAHKCCDELEEPEDEEEAAKRHKARLERLKAALEAEEDDEKKAVLKKRIEELESANPYGCNQYGHSWGGYHRGFSSNANIAKKKQDKKNAVAKLNEIARKRKK